MKSPAATTLLLYLLSTVAPAMACGTRLPEVQRQIEAAQLQRLRALAVEQARAADLVLIGTVTALERPVPGTDTGGRVTLAVSETLKGSAAPEQVLAWEETFIVSCDPSQSFGNVGFRDAGSFIVYVKDGRVARAAAADGLRDAALLTLDEERALVLEQVGE